jgi:surfeit locus 1 family protein
MKRRLWPIIIATTLGLAILLGLGTWQIKRLAWKNALIAKADAALTADPIPLDQALAKFLAGENIDYMRVKAQGHFAPRDPLRLLSSANSGPAWELIQGFEQPQGLPVLVARGKIAHNQPLPVNDGKDIEIVGHLIWHDQGRGIFDVDNKPDANLWYWWDVVAMTSQFSATHLEPNYAVVHLEPGSPGTEGLVVDLPKASLRNNHLGYAITWFGLAAALLVISGLFIRQRLGSPKPMSPDE